GCTCLRFFGIGWRRRRGPRACPTRRSSDLQPADDFRARGGPPSCGGCPDGRRRSLNRRRHLLTILFFSRGRGIVSRGRGVGGVLDRKSTRLNSSHVKISYAVFCVKKKTIKK